MDGNRKRQILRAEAYYAQLDELARALAERGFYVMGGIQPGVGPLPPEVLPETPAMTDAAPAFWKAPDSR